MEIKKKMLENYFPNQLLMRAMMPVDFPEPDDFLLLRGSMVSTGRETVRFLMGASGAGISRRVPWGSCESVSNPQVNPTL